MSTPPGTVVYMTLAGQWGWDCDVCGAASRYVYGKRERAEELATRHRGTCGDSRQRRVHRRRRVVA